jgi:hypothetical protein
MILRTSILVSQDCFFKLLNLYRYVKALHELRTKVAVDAAAAAAAAALARIADGGAGAGAHATGAVTAGTVVEPPDEVDEPELDATRGEVDAWLEKQDARRSAFEDPNAPLSQKFGEEGVVGLYKLNAVDPWLESAWFEPLIL